MNQTEPDPPARRSFAWGPLVSNLITASLVLPLVLFVFSLLGRFSFFAELAGNFRVQIVLLLIPFGCCALVAKRWWLGGLMFAAIGWSLVAISWIYLPGEQQPPGPQILKVMSYNVLADNDNHRTVIEQIRSANPDFVAILECSTHWQAALHALDEEFPYQVRVPRWHGFGVALLSKYPLLDSEIHQLTQSDTDCPLVISNVSFGEQKFRMVALHVVSPISRVRLKLRNEQFEEVAEILSDREGPTVVMGDFNCTPWSPFLRDFMADTGLRDSRRGFGHHATWPADKWMVRIPIDHALVSEGVHVHDRRVGDRSDSDHLPILFEISTTGSVD